MNNKKRLLFSSIFICFHTLSMAADTPPATIAGDEVDQLIATIKTECKKSTASCLTIIDQEDNRRASAASSMKLGLFGSAITNSAYEDDAHYFRYKTARNNNKDVFKIGIGFHIAANLKDADLSLSGSINGIGIETKPSKGTVQLRIDLLGIDYADSKNNLYAAIPISIELDSDSVKKLGNSISEKVKNALSDNENTKLYICPQVIDIRPNIVDDKNYAALRERAIKLQTDLNTICNNRFPNATMRFTDDVGTIGGKADGSGIGAITTSNKRDTVFQEYRRYRYDVENANGDSYGSVSLFGAKMYLSGLSNTTDLTSIASALFSMNGSKTKVAVQYLGYGLTTPGVMLSDISGTQIGQPTYIVNVYHGFQNAKDEIDKNANAAPQLLAIASTGTEARKVATAEEAVKAQLIAADTAKTASDAAAKASAAIKSGSLSQTADTAKAVSAAEIASKAAVAATAATKAAADAGTVTQVKPSTVKLEELNSVSN